MVPHMTGLSLHHLGCCWRLMYMDSALKSLVRSASPVYSRSHARAHQVNIWRSVLRPHSNVHDRDRPKKWNRLYSTRSGRGDSSQQWPQPMPVQQQRRARACAHKHQSMSITKQSKRATQTATEDTLPIVGVPGTLPIHAPSSKRVHRCSVPIFGKITSAACTNTRAANEQCC